MWQYKADVLSTAMGWDIADAEGKKDQRITQIKRIVMCIGTAGSRYLIPTNLCCWAVVRVVTALDTRTSASTFWARPSLSAKSIFS